MLKDLWYTCSIWSTQYWITPHSTHGNHHSNSIRMYSFRSTSTGLWKCAELSIYCWISFWNWLRDSFRLINCSLCIPWQFNRLSWRKMSDWGRSWRAISRWLWDSCHKARMPRRNQPSNKSMLAIWTHIYWCHTDSRNGSIHMKCRYPLLRRAFCSLKVPALKASAPITMLWFTSQ